MLTASSCHSNINRDVKRLTHKAEQCFSLINDNVTDEEHLNQFNSCYEELNELMDQCDKKYKGKKESEQFNKKFREEIMKADISDNMKEIIEGVYSLGDN